MILRGSIAGLVPIFALAAGAAAQELGWDGSAEVSASLFFGSNDQSIVSTRLDAGHADSTWDVAGGGRLKYGKSSDAEGESHLSHRSWSIDLTADYLPFATISWFALAGVESSFQQKIDLRSRGGAGVKYTFVRTETALLDVSLALLAERTSFDVDVPIASPEDGSIDEEETLGRWSWRLRAKREIGDDRVVLESETFYRPEIDALGRYVVETTQSAAYRVTDTVSLKLSFVDTYDSEAETRGARSNHDGQLLFGVLGTF